MITKLRIGNFRCLGGDVPIELGRFTAFVGPNGSGKSSALGSLSFLRDAMNMGLSGAITNWGGISSVRRRSSGRPFNVSVRVRAELPDGNAYYGFELTGDKEEEYRVKVEEADVTIAGTTNVFKIEDGRWAGPDGLRPQVDDVSLALPAIGGDERFRSLFDLLKGITVYSIYPDTLRVPQKYSPERPMRQHGDNWVSILKDQEPRTWKPELVAALRKLTGDIDDMRVAKVASYLIVQFQHGSSSKAKWFDSGQESDGTLRVAGILAALLQAPPLAVLGVEEPELTVHPGALPLLMDFFREASRRSQVIITTHSPELLDLVDADEVRIVERVDGVTRVAPMQISQRKTVRSGLMRLGELMTTAGLQAELFTGTIGE